MATSGYLCPQCGSQDVYRSRRRKPEKVLSLLGFYPFHCEDNSCDHRFYRRTRRSAKTQPSPWKTE